MEQTISKKRILTGDNATGKLHVGHYVGSLENRVRLQDEYEEIIIIADMAAFAYPKYVGDPTVVSDAVLQVAIDNLAVGLDPKKVKIFAESSVAEIFELTVILSMLTPYQRILRNPTIKDEIRDKNLGDNYSLGFLNFPVMMAADILSVGADLVPVGEDQNPHLELTRELAHRFNTTYNTTILKEPAGLVGNIARLVGTDGNAKMTKSLGNTIYLGESEVTLKEKIKKMFTDPNRLHPTDPGKVEGNPVFIYHDAFNPNKQEVADLKERYTKGTVGDVEVKDKLFIALNNFIGPIREKRAYYENHIDVVKDIIKTGNAYVGAEAKKTLNQVLSAMRL